MLTLVGTWRGAPCGSGLDMPALLAGDVWLGAGPQLGV